MSNLPAPFQDRRAFVTHWYRLKNGKVVSFRFHLEDNAKKHASMIRRGAVEIDDPFRKGAPLGGHAASQCPAKPQVWASL